MPKVDPIFIIGAIREKEKNFLQSDEYVRLMEHTQALRDTPYGETLADEITLASADAAIKHHLREELQWLSQYIDNDKVLAFMTSRYDAINIVSAIIQCKRGKKILELPSSLGSIAQDTLFAAIWDSHFEPLTKSAWKDIIEHELRAAQKTDWHASQILGRMPAHYATVLQKLAFTPLTKQLATIASHRSEVDAALRLEPTKTITDITQQLQDGGHTHIPQEAIQQVKNQISATAYELAWDTEVMAAISPYRFHVSGYDPIIAYWVAKQIESQYVRLIIAGKLANFTTAKIKSLARPYYQPASA